MLGDDSLVYGSPSLKITTAGQLDGTYDDYLNGAIALSISVRPVYPLVIWVVMGENRYNREIGRAIVQVNASLQVDGYEYKGERLC